MVVKNLSFLKNCQARKGIKIKKTCELQVIILFGGGRGTRTRDPLRAGQML